MFTAALFTIARGECTPLSTDKWMDKEKTWSMCTMWYCTDLKTKGSLSYDTTWMGLEDIMPRK
jgi:hypothetical protein